jgi:hypothetical protein
MCATLLHCNRLLTTLLLADYPRMLGMLFRFLSRRLPLWLLPWLTLWHRGILWREIHRVKIRVHYIGQVLNQGPRIRTGLCHQRD